MTAGLFDIALSLLEAWVQQHASAQPASRSVTFPEEIPRWVDALLLCLDMGMQPQPAGQPPPQVEQPQAPSVAATGAAAASTPAPAANPAAAGTSIAAPTAAPTAASAEIPTPAAAVSTDGAVPVGAATPAAAVSSSKAEASDTNEQTPAVQKKTTEERQRTATQLLRDSIRTMFMSNGLLSQQQLEHAASICMKLLHHLHAWGSVWTVPDSDLSDKEAFARPEPAASTQAVLQVLARVTKSHKVAVKVGCAMVHQAKGASVW